MVLVERLEEFFLKSLTLVFLTVLIELREIKSVQESLDRWEQLGELCAYAVLFGFEVHVINVESLFGGDSW
jgi:hypothetical protein